MAPMPLIGPPRAPEAGSCPQGLARPPTQGNACTRRFSLALFAASPILDVVGNEARLWKQELELYGRRGGDAVNGALGGVLPPKATISATQGHVPLDAEFAATLLACILAAAGPKATAVQAEASALAARELPAFEKAGTCGHCGTITGPAALKDRDYFDFQTYVMGKALVRLCRDDDSGSGAPSIDRLHKAMGDKILKHILSEVDVGEAEAVGITPFRAFATSTIALLSASPDLDSIRGGVQALLRYFVKKGIVRACGIYQFGLSHDEYENHLVWARGEPAYLKYWMTAPADLRSASALQSEEGASLGFVSAAVDAYLRRCGVVTEGLQRVPSLTDSSQVIEQLTLRRIKPLQNGGNGSYKPWKPDVCPNGEELECV